MIETRSRLVSRWHLAVRGIEANGVELVIWVVHVALPGVQVPALYPFCSPYSDDRHVVRLVLRQSVVDQPLFYLLLPSWFSPVQISTCWEEAPSSFVNLG